MVEKERTLITKNLKMQPKWTTLLIRYLLRYLCLSYSQLVYFYVQQSVIPDEDTVKVVTFNLELVNIGKAMEASTGVFTAPASGVYQFSFTISKYGYVMDEVYVHLRKNSNLHHQWGDSSLALHHSRLVP